MSLGIYYKKSSLAFCIYLNVSSVDETIFLVEILQQGVRLGFISLLIFHTPPESKRCQYVAKNVRKFVGRNI